MGLKEHKSNKKRADEAVDSLGRLVNLISDFVFSTSENELSIKPYPEKWSKKEIIGHLVDSGINNLQRFTEIQYGKHPFILKSYSQDELVTANNYQSAETSEILDFLIAINKRIAAVTTSLSDETLEFRVELNEVGIYTLLWLIEDYVHHFEHHTRQITI